MPQNIVSVLLIPPEGDPQRLLREGPCGARPAMAVRHETWTARGWEPAHSNGHGTSAVWHETWTARGWGCALVLYWEGAPVPSSLDEIAYRGRLTFSDDDWRHDCELADVMWLVKEAASLGLGTYALLDADGRVATP